MENPQAALEAALARFERSLGALKRALGGARPPLVTVCRSVGTGYTPKELAPLLQNRTLAGTYCIDLQIAYAPPEVLPSTETQVWGLASLTIGNSCFVIVSAVERVFGPARVAFHPGRFVDNQGETPDWAKGPETPGGGQGGDEAEEEEESEYWD